MADFRMFLWYANESMDKKKFEKQGREEMQYGRRWPTESPLIARNLLNLPFCHAHSRFAKSHLICFTVWMTSVLLIRSALTASNYSSSSKSLF